MWDLSINGVDFYHIANWFLHIQFSRLAVETCYVSVRKGKLIIREGLSTDHCVRFMDVVPCRVSDTASCQWKSARFFFL